MFDALVVGNSILDHVWSSEQRLIVDDKITVRRFAKYPGGQAANAAYTMARLGLKVEFAGSFGEDEDGEFCMQSLRDVGVGLNGSQSSKLWRSQTAAVLVDLTNSTRTIAMFRDKQMFLRPSAKIAELALRSRLVYVDGYEPEAQLAAFAATSKTEAQRIADIEVVDDDTRQLVSASDHLIISLNIALLLTKQNDIRAALNSLLEPATVVTTNGSAEIFARERDALSSFSVTAIDRADTTGVGDAFRAGYCAALLTGYQLDDRIRIACDVAGAKLRCAGPRISSPLELPALRARVTAPSSS